jgi:alkylhydroperoxidase/carboxymuconolactone decarboxylase family protein YurZ
VYFSGIEATSAIAKARGATNDEINEAVALAAHTRNMSTLLNGIQYPEAAFKNDVQRLIQPKGKKSASAR